MIASIGENLLSDEFGTNQINNSAAKNARAVEDKNFEKILTMSEKRTIKQSVSIVDDYFEFDLRPFADKQFANQEEENSELLQNIIFDEDAERVIRTARISALFDC